MSAKEGILLSNFADITHTSNMSDLLLSHSHPDNRTSDTTKLIMEEFNLCDIWRNFQPAHKQYTRHQIKKTLPRLDFILVSNNFVNNCVQSKILQGI